MTQKRSKRLGVVRNIAELRKRDAEKYLAEHLQRVENDKLQLEQLEQYLQQYEAELANVMQGGASLLQVQNYQAFLKKISATILQHKQAMKINEEQLAQVKEYWMQQYAKHSALDSLVTKAVEKENFEADKALQKTLDEASQRFKSSDF